MDKNQRHMVAQVARVENWVAKPLTKFAILEMTEVYRIDLDGRRESSIGYFKSPVIAKAFAGQQTDSNYYKTATQYVLTDGMVGFLVAKDVVELIDDENTILDIKRNALAKLSEEERAVLGLI